MTRKLYQANSYQQQFQARVQSAQAVDGGLELILDQTCFYATAGGQPFDRGTINGVAVTDVFARDDAVVHLLDTSSFDAVEVDGQIDWDRRYDHMQQHTGQHLLSETLIRLFDAETLSFHLGDSYCTVDIPVKKLTKPMVEHAETACAELIRENRPIHIHQVEPDDISRFPLRKQPPDVDTVRIVEISEYDYSPCGGTHVRTTAELNVIKIIGTEKVKQGTRVKFLCGDRALADYQAKHTILDQLSADMTCDWRDVSDIWQKSVTERKTDRKQVAELQKQLAVFQAQDMVGRAERLGNVALVHALLENHDMTALGELCRQVTAQAEAVVLLMGTGEKLSLAFACSESIDLNMSQLVRDACQQLDGRGGGRPQIAQGAAPSNDTADLVLNDIVQTVREALV